MGGAVVPAESWEQALAWRMQHHLVDRAEPAELDRIVSDICGLQAQVMSSAELSVWARSCGHDQRASAGAPSRNPFDGAGIWSSSGVLAAPCTCSRQQKWASGCQPSAPCRSLGTPESPTARRGPPVERSTGEP